MTSLSKLYELAGVFYEKDMITKNDFQYMVDLVKEFSKAKTERPKMHWIAEDGYSIRCSHCDKKFAYQGPGWKCCPVCEAKCVEEEQDGMD